MKTIAIGAVTAGGKATLVHALKARLPKAASLHFDDYSFAGAVEDFGKWLSEGADCQVWDLSPLKADIEKIRNSGDFDYLLLDYPFAYLHNMIRDDLDCCIFLDTPLDIALARRILRDLQEASADDIRNAAAAYVKYERPAYLHALETVLPSPDYVLDGTKPPERLLNEAMQLILSC